MFTAKTCKLVIIVENLYIGTILKLTLTFVFFNPAVSLSGIYLKERQMSVMTVLRIAHPPILAKLERT